MKKMVLFSFIFLQAFKAQCIEGSMTLEKLLSEKSPSLAALENEIKAKENILKYAYTDYYPTLNAVGGLAEHKVADPQDREKGTFGYLEGRFNLFNGLQDKKDIQQRETDLEISKLEYEQKRRNLRIDLTVAISEMIALHKTQDILIQEARITKEQKQMAARKVSAGLTSSVDNLEFDLRQEEIEIQQRQIDQQHYEAHQKMIQLFGFDIPDKDLEVLQFSPVQDLIKLKPFNSEQTLDVRKSQLLTKKADLEYESIGGEYLPLLDFIYSYGKITPSEDSSPFDESSYRLQITIPLFSGFSTVYKEKAAFFERKNNEFNLKQNTLDALSLYNSLESKLKELNDLYNINERKLQSSEKYFNMTVSEYKRGVKNSPDLVGATERWFSSQKRKPEILKEMELVKSQLEQITGI